MEKQLQTAYVLDLGNGFTKRSMDSKTIKTEPSIIGKHKEGFQIESDLDVVNVNNQREIYIGNDVWDADVPAMVALEDGEINRVKTQEFSELLLGFISKDFQQKSVEKITLPLLVLGLPNTEYEEHKDFLEKEFKGIFGVKMNGRSRAIEIKAVKVIPQPVGTILYSMSSKLLNGKTSLIIDGGFGTIDLTELNGKQIGESYGADLGMRKPLVQIEKYIRQKYRNVKNLNPHMVSDILQNGLVQAGKTHSINNDDRVVEILSDHFREVYSYLIERFDFRDYDQVIWTGGMALAHNEAIKHKDQFGNFVVLDENGQEANVRGYSEYGKVVLGSGK
ncbi:ParM/StbA family protein (plasmid) [Halobacillus litoralis]|uniref:ParM/StbA family protein n=1 Tax=Halobacillus litoralis TaxID=45668 RepID=UPI001CFDB696|nr:ParM/StbA family protein [Halobacillus litoralis]WLR49605.1 ParM/StbA family protein [Halobacillus litoralis]